MFYPIWNYPKFVRGLVAAFLCSHSLMSLADESHGLTTFAVVQNTLTAAPSCLRYKIIGICFWRVCAGPYCWIEETLKVDHYLPDAVVSVYRKQESNPWDYAQTLVDPLAKQEGQAQVKAIMGFDMGYGNENNTSPHDQNNHFKEADLIGNPTIMLFKSYPQVFLPSQANSFLPYYLSQVDAYLWRSPLVEMAIYPLSWIPGRHIVGSLVSNWGNVYPRTGFITQPADAKAAAVIAQRVADIGTRDKQPHVYHSLNSTNSCGIQCQVWETTENDSNTQWQMVYPLAETRCRVFGENDLVQPHPWGQEAAEKGTGNYAWILWRRYKGCIPGKGTYVGSIDF